MSQKVREEMLPRLRQRYANRGRQGRARMIDELCEQFGCSRKHAIKLLNARAGWGGDPAVCKGRPPEYGAEVVEVLWRIWKVSEQPCGKRLVAMLTLWLPHYEAEHGKLPTKVNFSIVRELTLKVLRDHPGKLSLRRKRRRATLDPNFRLQILGSLHA